MNLSRLQPESVLGKVVRLPARLIPASATVRVLQGPSRGMKWVVGAHTHGCWLGSHEYERRLVLEHEVTAGQVIYDVGAHAGYYTLIAASLVGSSGRVYAFEPSPANLQYLRRHVAINRLDNVEVHAVALADTPGVVRFEGGTNRAEGRISADGTDQVPAVSIDHFVYDLGHAPPDLVKLDVEGAEVLVLSGAARLLVERPPTIIVEVHDAKPAAEVTELLESNRYDVSEIFEKRLPAPARAFYAVPPPR